MNECLPSDIEIIETLIIENYYKGLVDDVDYFDDYEYCENKGGERYVRTGYDD